MSDEKFDENLRFEYIYKLNYYNHYKNRHFFFSSKLKIFGKSFVDNNENKCKIIYNNKKYKLKEYFDY